MIKKITSDGSRKIHDIFESLSPRSPLDKRIFLGGENGVFCGVFAKNVVQRVVF
jgi:hypothetical protein